jgi:hypothetical protein
MKPRTAQYAIAAAVMVLLVLGLGLGLTASDAEPPLPKDQFGLTVERMYETSEDLVMRLRVEATPGLYRLVWSPATGSSWMAMILDEPETADKTRAVAQKSPSTDHSHPGDIWLMGSTQFQGRRQWIKTVLGGHREVHATTDRMETYQRLNVTVTPGRYPLEEPLLIGEVDGAAVYLAVGTAAELDRLRESYRGQPVSTPVHPQTSRSTSSTSLRSL